jgi:hypothetical protein
MKAAMLSGSLIFAAMTLCAQAQEEVSEDRLPLVLKAADDRGNRDGKIQWEELPEKLQRFFGRYDLDGDGVITPQEVEEGKARVLAEQPKLEDVIGDLPPGTLDLLGGRLYEVGWSEGKLFDAVVKRTITHFGGFDCGGVDSRDNAGGYGAAFAGKEKP